MIPAIIIGAVAEKRAWLSTMRMLLTLVGLCEGGGIILTPTLRNIWDIIKPTQTLNNQTQPNTPNTLNIGKI